MRRLLSRTTHVTIALDVMRFVTKSGQRPVAIAELEDDNASPKLVECLSSKSHVCSALFEVVMKARVLGP